MSDGEYGYLAVRLVAEQNRARTATCKEAATVHQKLANAYSTRLQFLILSPGDYSELVPLIDREWHDTAFAENRHDPYLHLRIGNTQRGNAR